MGVFNTRVMIFAFNCYLAAVMALYVSFSLNLSNPWWAMLTVFITSQPLAGAIWSKAFYRVIGTLFGVAAALILVPNLVDAPELLLLAMAGWMGLCLYLSLLDRTPRGYAIMLAGYTAVLVGLPQVVDPSNLFDAAVARAEEISIGVICTALTHGLIFPRSVEGAMLAKLDASLTEAKGWILAALAYESEAAARIARRRLATDLTELTLLAGSLRFEVIASRRYINTMRALEERMIALLPLLSAVDDRLKALRESGTISPAIEQLMRDVRAWIIGQQITGKDNSIHVSTYAESTRANELINACHATSPQINASSTWTDILALNFTTRLADLIRAWGECLDLNSLVHQPHQPLSAQMRNIVNVYHKRPLHIDHGMAAYSAITVAIAMLACAGFAMATGWLQGIAAVGLTAVMCSLFATSDDPTPLQQKMLVSTLLALPVAALYDFALLPAIDSFPMLALVLFPLIIPIAMVMTIPAQSLRALSFGLVVSSGIALQPMMKIDFVSFISGNLVAIVGTLMALLVTMVIRVVGADFSAKRILHAGWRELVFQATGRIPITQTIWASRMLDRLGLLIPRLATTTSVVGLEIDDALKDLPIGYNVIDLRIAALDLPSATGAQIHVMLGHLAAYFEQLQRDGYSPPQAYLVDEIDHIIRAMLQQIAPAPNDDCAQAPIETRMRGLIASVGLRRNLFPAAAAFQPIAPLNTQAREVMP
jgi:uncharacterized membrane protein YccC